MFKKKKKIFKKAKESKEDPDISILNYRAAPKTNAKSPAELLMGRKIRTLLPIVKYHRKKNKDKENSCFSKQRYDRKLPELKPGAYIRYRHKGLWEPAQVVSRATTLRSYIIKTKDGMLRRNRQHLLVNGEKHHSLIPTPVEYTPRFYICCHYVSNGRKHCLSFRLLNVFLYMLSLCVQWQKTLSVLQIVERVFIYAVTMCPMAENIVCPSDC